MDWKNQYYQNISSLNDNSLNQCSIDLKLQQAFLEETVKLILNFICKYKEHRIIKSSHEK